MPAMEQNFRLPFPLDYYGTPLDSMPMMQGVNNFDDVAGMQDAGIDTEDVVRTAMVAFMEGAVVEGIFHGDLHGGNLFVLADGRTGRGVIRAP